MSAQEVDTGAGAGVVRGSGVGIGPSCGSTGVTVLRSLGIRSPTGNDILHLEPSLA